MTPTAELRGRLRRFINERIPQDGSEYDTRFTDDDLDDLIEGAADIYSAAAEGWIIKAGMYQEEMGELEATRSGQEQYQRVSLQERLEYARSMYELYNDLAESGGAHKKKMPSVFLGATRPEV